MLLDHLSGLEAAGLIRLIQTDPEWEYLFRHALVQEAAYESMLKEDRKRLHQAVGQVLEALYPNQAEEVAATLAYHFSRAEDEPRALRYFVLAGDVAFRRYAIAEAITHYSRALDLAHRIGDTAEVPWQRLYENLGRAFELDSQYARALEIYEEMGAMAQARGDRATELIAVTEHAKVHATPNLAHDAAESQALAERALALARELDNRSAEARIEWVLMIVGWLHGDPRTSLVHGERSLALARQHELREQLAFTLQDLHRSLGNVGRMDEAKVALYEARDLWRELNNLPMLADNLASTADLLLTNGEYDAALKYADEAWRLSQSIGNLWNQAFGRAMAGEVHEAHGEFGQALPALLEARELSARAGLVILTMRVHRRLAYVYQELNALDKARQMLQYAREDEQADALLRDVFQVDALLMLCHLEIRAGRLEAAAAALREALAPANESPRRRAVAVAIAQAALSLARGEHAAALGILDELLASAGSALRPQHGPQICHLKGQALLGLGRPEEAAPLLREAARQARALGLRQDLWQVLGTLGECESRQGNAAAAATAFGEARQLLDAVAAGIGDPDLRGSFLSRSDVRAVLDRL